MSEGAFMKVPIYLAAVLLLVVFLATLHGAPSTENTQVDSPSGSRRPELEYLKAVNTVAPPQDTQLLFLLMAEYSSANMQGEGAEFFAARLKEFDPRLTDGQKALYLSIIGLLRAQHASSVSLLHRIGYVKDTIAILDQDLTARSGRRRAIRRLSQFCKGKNSLPVADPSLTANRAAQSRESRRSTTP
jgi:hypothetical protein